MSVRGGELDLSAYPVIRLDQITDKCPSKLLEDAANDAVDLIATLKREDPGSKLIQYLHKQIDVVHNELTRRAANDRVKALLNETAQVFNDYNFSNIKKPVHAANDDSSHVSVKTSMSADGKVTRRSITAPSSIITTTTDVCTSDINNSDKESKLIGFKPIPLPSESSQIVARPSRRSRELSGDNDKNDVTSTSASDNSAVTPSEEIKKARRRPLSSGMNQANGDGPDDLATLVVNANFGTTFVVAATEKKIRHYPKKIVKEDPEEVKARERLERRKLAMKRLIDRREEQQKRQQLLELSKKKKAVTTSHVLSSGSSDEESISGGEESKPNIDPVALKNVEKAIASVTRESKVIPEMKKPVLLSPVATAVKKVKNEKNISTTQPVQPLQPDLKDKSGMSTDTTRRLNQNKGNAIDSKIPKRIPLINKSAKDSMNPVVEDSVGIDLSPASRDADVEAIGGTSSLQVITNESREDISAVESSSMQPSDLNTNDNISPIESQNGLTIDQEQASLNSASGVQLSEHVAMKNLAALDVVRRLKLEREKSASKLNEIIDQNTLSRANSSHSIHTRSNSTDEASNIALASTLRHREDMTNDDNAAMSRSASVKSLPREDMTNDTAVSAAVSRVASTKSLHNEDTTNNDNAAMSRSASVKSLHNEDMTDDDNAAMSRPASVKSLPREDMTNDTAVSAAVSRVASTKSLHNDDIATNAAAYSRVASSTSLDDENSNGTITISRAASAKSLTSDKSFDILRFVNKYDPEDDNEIDEASLDVSVGSNPVARSVSAKSLHDDNNDVAIGRTGSVNTLRDDKSLHDLIVCNNEDDNLLLEDRRPSVIEPDTTPVLDNLDKPTRLDASDSGLGHSDQKINSSIKINGIKKASPAKSKLNKANLKQRGSNITEQPLEVSLPPTSSQKPGAKSIIIEENGVYTCQRGPDELPGLQAWILSHIDPDASSRSVEWGLDMRAFNDAMTKARKNNIEGSLADESTSFLIKLRSQRAQLIRTAPYGLVVMVKQLEKLLRGYNAVTKKPFASVEEFYNAWYYSFQGFDNVAAAIDSDRMFEPVKVCGNFHGVIAKVENLLKTHFAIANNASQIEREGATAAFQRLEALTDNQVPSYSDDDDESLILPDYSALTTSGQQASPHEVEGLSSSLDETNILRDRSLPSLSLVVPATQSTIDDDFIKAFKNKIASSIEPSPILKFMSNPCHKILDIFPHFGMIFPIAYSTSGPKQADSISAHQLIESMQTQCKVYEEWLEVMSDYATVFSEDRGVKAMMVAGDNNNSTAVYKGGTRALHYRVKSQRPEVYNIVSDAFTTMREWEELPGGLGLGLSWNLLWTWSKPKINMTHLLVCQRVNHFYDSKQLTRKDLLKKNLQRFTDMTGSFCHSYIHSPTYSSAHIQHR